MPWRLAALSVRSAPGSLAAASRGSLEPVVEVDLRTFAEVGAKTPGPAQPGQAAGAGSGDHEPVAAHYVVLDGSGVLEQERALAAAHGPGDPLDPDEARRPVRARRLQELDDAGARDVAAEDLLDVDPGERRTLSRLVVGCGLVLLNRDNRVRAGRHRV